MAEMLGKGENGTGWAVEFTDGVRLERKVNLDHGALEQNESGYGLDGEMTISELMEWRYLMTEREKEKVRALHLSLIENIELNINE